MTELEKKIAEIVFNDLGEYDDELNLASDWQKKGKRIVADSIAHAVASQLCLDRVKVSEKIYKEINNAVTVIDWDLEYPSIIKTKKPHSWKQICLRVAVALSQADSVLTVRKEAK